MWNIWLFFWKFVESEFVNIVVFFDNFDWVEICVYFYWYCWGFVEGDFVYVVLEVKLQDILCIMVFMLVLYGIEDGVNYFLILEDCEFYFGVVYCCVFILGVGYFFQCEKLEEVVEEVLVWLVCLV